MHKNLQISLPRRMSDFRTASGLLTLHPKACSESRVVTPTFSEFGGGNELPEKLRVSPKALPKDTAEAALKHQDVFATKQ